jgi:hypothetical protein
VRRLYGQVVINVLACSLQAETRQEVADRLDAEEHVAQKSEQNGTSKLSSMLSRLNTKTRDLETGSSNSGSQDGSNRLSTMLSRLQSRSPGNTEPDVVGVDSILARAESPDSGAPLEGDSAGSK